MEKEILTKIPEGERDLRIVVWENVERYRKQKGVSIDSFCESVGFPIRTYRSNLKYGGATLSFPTLQKFAYVLNVKTIDLLEDWS